MALVEVPARPGSAAEPGELSPREPLSRLALLFDSGKFQLLAGDDECGALAAVGPVGGLPAAAFANDPRIQGGALGLTGCQVITAAYDIALRRRLPIVGIWQSGGARLADGVESLHGVGTVFSAMTRASGVVPQISAVIGPAAGGAAYGPALTDVVVMSENGRIFVTGPDVVRSVTGEDATAEILGGPAVHAKLSGVAHVVAVTDAAALRCARDLVGLLADQRAIRAGSITDKDLSALLPQSARRAYDVHPLIAALLDEPGVELHTRWAPNIVTQWGRLAGRTIGVVANNPLRLGGCLDSASAEKAARFVRTCDALGVPLIVLVDVPGYLPGVRQEREGVVRRGAKLLHAFAEASVPRITLITRKAYGGAYLAMNSRALGATHVLAWPAAEVAVMGPLAAVRVLHRKRLAAASEPERAALEAELAADHERTVGGLSRAVQLGVVDAVIDPAHTRSALARLLASAPVHRGRHTNIPL